MSELKELAKELCDKSGCHHKCHDTKDCVVEDESKLMVSDKEKQIEEMVVTLYEGMLPLKETYSASELASILYNAGYRKQIEGEWQIAVDPVEATFICSKCGYFYIEADPQAKTEYKYCPHCGSKMKGGE